MDIGEKLDNVEKLVFCTLYRVFNTRPRTMTDDG